MIKINELQENIIKTVNSGTAEQVKHKPSNLLTKKYLAEHMSNRSTNFLQNELA